MTEDTINEEVLVSYIKGELTAARAAAVDQWYDASTENQKMLQQIYYVLYLNDRINAATDIDVETSLKKFKTRIAAKRNPTRLLRRIAWRGIAAVMLVGLVVSAVWTTASVVESKSRPFAIITQFGERSHVLLPDGSRVWLNSCSRVEYSSPLFSRKRHVKMMGEAYFDVRHDKHSPFIVSTSGLDIQVLGTKFNVRNDEAKHTVTTVLLEGSVMAHPTDNSFNSVYLRPSQQLVFNTQTQHMYKSNCETAEQSIGWIDGRFMFDQNTFEEIAAELCRYYNVEIRFMDNKLRSERFSGNFKIEDGIFHIMSILQLTYKFNYKIEQNDIVIYAH